MIYQFFILFSGLLIKYARSLDLPFFSTIKTSYQELLANKNDQKSLQNLLEKYVDNIDILNQEAIFDFVTKEYSIEKKINEIQKIYDSVLNS